MNREELINSNQKLSNDTTVYFFHEHEENGFLSQWYKSKFTENGIEFNTAEQYMMYKKAELFNDDIVKQKILSTSNPKIIKALGREVKNFDEKIWNEHKYNIVLQGNILKFSQNGILKTLLIGTGNKILVEASPYDKIWGIGIDPHNADRFDPNLWKGQNLLGFAIMEAREKILN